MIYLILILQDAIMAYTICLGKMISDVYTIIWSESVKFYSSDPTTPPCPKRKSGVEVERCPKKSKPQENKSALPKRRHDVLSDEIILGLKRRLRLDDPIPAKKIKQVECGSGELLTDQFSNY
jgi:hypothetical protein